MLFNGSHTKEFNMECGLRYNDPLSPFMFVIVVEGLTRFVKKVVDQGDSQGS